MRVVYLLLLCLVVEFGFSQTPDSVNLNTNFTDMTFYKLANGAKTTASNTDWHLAFGCKSAQFPNNTLQAATIRFNGALGVRLFLVHNKTKADFSSIIDTAGLQLVELFDQDTMLWMGGFNSFKNLTDVFNYGWGQYQFTSHSVVGDSLYLLQMPNGNYKKIVIDRLEYDTAYFFNFANINGTNPQSNKVNKKTYRTKNFVYFDVENNIIRDKEPAKTYWDLLFWQYKSPTLQNLTATEKVGVFQNDGIAVFQSTDANLNQCADQSYSYYANTIGKTWKGQATLIPESPEIFDTVNYYIKDYSANHYRLKFTDQWLSNQGIVRFSVLRCAAGIENIQTSPLAVYPNPANNVIYLDLSSSEKLVKITVFNQLGSEVKVDLINEKSLNINNLSNGIYFAHIVTNTGNYQAKFIVEK